MTSPEVAHRQVVDAADDLGRLENLVGELLSTGASQSVWQAIIGALLERLDVAPGHPERRRRLALLSRLPRTEATVALARVAHDPEDPDAEYALSLVGRARPAQSSQEVRLPLEPERWQEETAAAAPPPPVSAGPVRVTRGSVWSRLRHIVVDRARSFPRSSPEPVGAEPPPEMTAGPPTGPAVGAELEGRSTGGATTPRAQAAHPLIACNPVWVTDEEEKVTIGLTPKLLAAVGGTGPVVSADEAEVDDLTVTLLLDPSSIVLAEGTQRTHPLPVTPHDRYPSVEVTMTARSGVDLADERRIGLHFRRGGQSVGFAWRRIRVVDSRAEVAGARPPSLAPDMLDLAALTDERPPDLVLAVYRGDDTARSAFVWDAFSPSDSVAVLDSERTSGIAPGDAAEFATQTRRTISGTTKGVPLFAQMEGYGVDIARAMPDGIVATVREVATGASGTAASVLLVTEEAAVPWELAVFRDPPLETSFSSSPFLGAHVAISRWPLVTGKPRPTPRDTHTIATSAVLTAKYRDVADWPRLEHAEAEAARVAEAYGATTLKPLWTQVRDCLEGTPPADWIHVALHGQFDPQGDEDGLVLLDGEPPDLTQQFLTTRQMQSLELPRRPFVFLNACQVGSGKQVLGSYSGMAVALLRGGATAVVAAQWNIDDVVAAAVSDTFYASVFHESDPVPVAEALRAIRATYTESNVAADPERFTPTLIAYQLFGHPRLTLRRPDH